MLCITIISMNELIILMSLLQFDWLKNFPAVLINEGWYGYRCKICVKLTFSALRPFVKPE